MKKIVASVGLVALGASGIQTASAQPVLGGPPGAKPWNVSATLRGFYDDNVNTLPSAALPPGQPAGSWGFEISPGITLGWALEQTTINLGFVYSLLYYENKPIGNADHYDQNYIFNAGITHTFNERLQGQVNDSFVIGQEPDALRAGNAFSTFQRVSGDNIRNYGALSLDAQLTPLFGMSVGYDNAYYDYANTGVSFAANGNVVPSYSGTLDRDENGVHLEGLFTLQPETKLIVGGRFRDIGYNGDELIAGTRGFVAGPIFFPSPNGNVILNPLYSDSRNFRQYVGYVGVQQTFRPDLMGVIRVGASYADYYNDPTTSNNWSPYVDSSLTWSYAEESYLQAGFSYDLQASDQVNFGGVGNFTTSIEAAVFYLKLNHRMDFLTPKLVGSVTGTFQNSLYQGGTADGESEQFYLLGLNLEYRFTENFSADLGYDYDNLQSPIPISPGGSGRGYSRNRVYMALTAKY